MVLCYSIPSLLTSDNNDFVLCCDNVTPLPSPAMQEILKRNNIQYLKKWEIVFSLAYLSAIWLLFWENPIEPIVDKYFLLNLLKFLPNSW